MKRIWVLVGEHNFPIRSVRTTRSVHPTPEAAHAVASEALDLYARATWPGGMGAVIGATAVEVGFKGVYVTYYSRS